jgi:hypothetical protein
MHSNDWNKQDDLILRLYSPSNPLAQGHEGLDEVLDFIESLDEALRPNSVYLKRDRKYSRQLIHERLHEFRFGNSTSIDFERTKPTASRLELTFFDQGAEDTCFSLHFKIAPFAVVLEEDMVKEHARRLMSLVHAFARCFPISYGLAHSYTDISMGSDPHLTDPRAPKGVYEAYWLNVYGPRLVEQLGRERVLSTPADHLEELPGGAVLWLTRPTPADFDSEEARLAQARALVHLRPELKLEETLATLRQRSLVFAPIPVEFDADVADILWWKVEHLGLADQRKNVERFNAYRPPPVSEWLPAAQAPASDVEDVQGTIDTYEGHYAEQLIALFHKKIPALMKGSIEALPQVDYELWHWRWGALEREDDKEALIPALGAWLGMFLVHTLGGRWVPRRKLEETAVVIGDRAWLPFLRARHALQGREAPLDSSCSQLFRLAQRLVRASSS